MSIRRIHDNEQIQKFLRNKCCSKIENLSLYASRDESGYYLKSYGKVSEYGTLDSTKILEPLLHLLPSSKF
jgi:hypothetical protein